MELSTESSSNKTYNLIYNRSVLPVETIRAHEKPPTNHAKARTVRSYIYMGHTENSVCPM